MDKPTSQQDLITRKKVFLTSHASHVDKEDEEKQAHGATGWNCSAFNDIASIIECLEHVKID